MIKKFTSLIALIALFLAIVVAASPPGTKAAAASDTQIVKVSPDIAAPGLMTNLQVTTACKFVNIRAVAEKEFAVMAESKITFNSQIAASPPDPVQLKPKDAGAVKLLPTRDRRKPEIVIRS